MKTLFQGDCRLCQGHSLKVSSTSNLSIRPKCDRGMGNVLEGQIMQEWWKDLWQEASCTFSQSSKVYWTWGSTCWALWNMDWKLMKAGGQQCKRLLSWPHKLHRQLYGRQRHCLGGNLEAVHQGCGVECLDGKLGLRGIHMHTPRPQPGCDREAGVWRL